MVCAVCLFILMYGYSYLLITHYFNPSRTFMIFLHFYVYFEYDLCTLLSGFGTKAGLYCVLEKVIKSFMPYIFIYVDMEFIYLCIVITCCVFRQGSRVEQFH